ncbi:hypothetical protein VNO80_01299 [Phaseolus coccineus]|uniref:Uncharacterized protein n=1 Tax=Phaseolus coccineus TaxID=3886 RepID=A0AAN9RSM7_PHACN
MSILEQQQPIKEKLARSPPPWSVPVDLVVVLDDQVHVWKVFAYRKKNVELFVVVLDDQAHLWKKKVELFVVVVEVLLRVISTLV